MARHRIHRFGRFSIQRVGLSKPWFATYQGDQTVTVFLPWVSIIYNAKGKQKAFNEPVGLVEEVFHDENGTMTIGYITDPEVLRKLNKED